MTLYEVREVAGRERSIRDGYLTSNLDDKDYNYGDIWVQMEDGVVGCIEGIL